MMQPSSWIHMVADDGNDAVAGDTTPSEASVFLIEEVSEMVVVIRHL
jgi:hypothetical protein